MMRSASSISAAGRLSGELALNIAAREVTRAFASAMPRASASAKMRFIRPQTAGSIGP